jgi:hypothetical protein
VAPIWPIDFLFGSQRTMQRVAGDSGGQWGGANGKLVIQYGSCSCRNEIMPGLISVIDIRDLC